MTVKRGVTVDEFLPENENIWEVDGADLIDKALLVGEPFEITALCFKRGAGGIEYVFCDALLSDGRTVSFSDSSTKGIRFQLAEMWLKRTGEDPTYPTDETWNDVRIACRKGLRVSEFEVEGQKKKGRTYYLAANGRRATV